MTRLWVWVECAALFVGLPLIFTFVLPVRGLFGALWLTAFYALWRLKTQHGMTLQGMWNGAALTRANLTPILRRFVISACLLTAGVALFEPEKWFSLPRERPVLWAAVMCFYPLLSVIPQEILFRSFFFERYQRFFSQPQGWLIANAFVFGYAHIIFQNWVSVLLCVIGGYFFAQTYVKTRSLALVWVEHALYGCFIFTVGLGYYFYHGTVAAVGG